MQHGLLDIKTAQVDSTTPARLSDRKAEGTKTSLYNISLINKQIHASQQTGYKSVSPVRGVRVLLQLASTSDIRVVNKQILHKFE